MPLLRIRDRLIFFAHVPKAGGTSLERYLIARFGPLMLHDWTWANCRLRRRSLTASPQHIDGADVDRLFPPGALDWTFAVVREPVARLLSEYRYQSHSHNIASPLRRLLARPGFSVWLAMALSAARRDPVFLDNHLRPQVEMLPRNAEAFRLEDGFAPVVTRLDSVCGEGRPDLDVGHHLQGTAAPRAARPSRQDLILINKAFAEDFEAFGYAPPDPDAAPSDPWAPLKHLLGRLLSPLARISYRAGLM